MTKHVLPENLVYAGEMDTKLVDLGSMEYSRARQLQLCCVEDQFTGKDRNEKILLVEHPPVFTLGKNGNVSSLLKTKEEISAKGIAVIHTERGGDVTYHGPGQLVVYPIVNLRKRKLAVTDFVATLEEIMIKTAADFGVFANRDVRNRGIWVAENKLGSVGIRVRHGISFHGLALNVNLALEPFQWIQPCGLAGVGVTSLKQELGLQISLEKVKKSMSKHIIDLLCETEKIL